ncbi:conserved hypothetical protein [Catenulispora acidiphila DSM 44928]|uniref:DUF7919 domain-containing protein n=1 Tax=Catenulispora acidiphila (strain DSM 44928 / JCM 14897 / NBRC 102108 / NRRL B-24433 / ID139908) TaxID=479433 RepID=C7QH58_CATAD|nr:hypothetical protein [Catenulispora acidiphila]ACU76908.1 conserved hypothetical protein [Catenulispora acidiphila DSM 44928]
MTYFPDLAPYDYLPETVPHGVELLTVGWLEPGHDFETEAEPLAAAFWPNLITLAADHPVAVTRSVHGCRFRHLFEADYQYRAVYGTRVLYLGSAEIRVVAADGRWLTAPTLVVHYVRDHGYRPPPEFVEAVAAMRVAPE